MSDHTQTWRLVHDKLFSAPADIPRHPIYSASAKEAENYPKAQLRSTTGTRNVSSSLMTDNPVLMAIRSPPETSHVDSSGTNEAPSLVQSHNPDTDARHKRSCRRPLKSSLIKGSAVPRQLIFEIHHFVQLQDESTIMRVQIRKRRQTLGKLRAQVAEYDDKIIAALQKGLTAGESLGVEMLSTLVDSCQLARDALGPVEDELDKLEIALGRREFDISNKADVIARLVEHLEHDITTEPQLSDASSHISFETASFVDKSKASVEPLDSQVSTLEYSPDRAALPERSYYQLLIDPAFHHPNANIAQSPGFTQDDSLLEESAPDLSEQSWGLSADPNVGDQHEQSLTVEDIPYTSQNETALDTESAILLPPGDDDSNSKLSGYLTEFASTRSRINLWLLHKLRTSPTEIVHLQQAVIAESITVPDWQKHALEVWDFDAAATSPNSTSSSADSIAPTENPDSLHSYKRRTDLPLAYPHGMPVNVPGGALAKRLRFFDLKKRDANSVTSSAPAAIKGGEMTRPVLEPWIR